MDYQSNVNHAQQGGYAANVRTVTAPADLAPDATKVRDAITASEQLQSEIAEQFARLEARLETVLRPMPPQGQSGPSVATPQPVCSHLVGRLHILNDGFASISARIRELRDRIEV